MEFEKQVPEWEATGTEPPDTLKSTGFQAGYKPPAAYFNWFWHGVSACLTEIRNVISNLTASDIGAATSFHSHDVATTSANGFMHKDDKSKLNGIAANANNYTHPTTTGNKHIPSGGVSGQALYWSADGTAQWSLPGLPIVNAASSDGIAYTATINGLTALTNGMPIIFIPGRTTASIEPTLNVNGLGAIPIRRKLSGGTATVSKGGLTSFFYANRPCLLIYDTAQSASNYWIAVEFTQPSSSDLYGTVALTKGGTGATTAADARTNLGAAQAWTTEEKSGAVSFTVADKTDYSCAGVTSLTMTGAVVEAHGFVTFSTSTPTINVSGFTASGGDDITEAAASEVWEFSVYPHNNKSYIVWKNWSA